MTQGERRRNRIDVRLAELAAQGKKAFLTYLVGGHPDEDSSLAQMRCLVRSGIDILEVGYPFSDPILDGPIIQSINRKAVSAGASLARTIDLCAAFRAAENRTSLILMGYANPIAVLGYGAFARRAAEAGVDGAIVADMPLREAGPLLAELSAVGLYFIPLAAPTLPAREFAAELRGVGGFLYCIPVVGPTGGPSATDEETARAVARCRSATSLPVIVGFGIKSPAATASAARCGDGVVVASALLERFESVRRNRGLIKALKVLSGEISAYRQAIDTASLHTL